MRSYTHYLIIIELPDVHTGQKNDKSERRPILRPIICICNDLYASSLTKLRTHARIIRLTRTADLHLVKRLREICEKERLKADSRALTALVGVAQGDLRGCLNTLQVRLLHAECHVNRRFTSLYSF